MRYDQRAHRAVQAAVNRGVLPHISTCQCVECGSVAAHYHHYAGYQPEQWLAVEPLCASCHLRKPRERKPKKFTESVTFFTVDDDRYLLKELTKFYGKSQSAVLRMLIQTEAKERGIEVGSQQAS